jgi:hypothetical protein
MGRVDISAIDLPPVGATLTRFRRFAGRGIGARLRPPRGTAHRRWSISLQYEHYLIPALAHCRYRPEARAIDAVVDGLRAAGWVDPGATLYPVTLSGDLRQRRHIASHHVGKEIEDLLAADKPLALRLPLAADRASTAAQDLVFRERPQGHPLGRDVCQEIELLLCPRMCVVPSFESAGELRCGGCQQELLGALEASRAGAWDQSPPELEGKLDACPGCRQPVDLSRLFATYRSALDGAVHREEAPLFRFALVMTSDAPPDFPAVTEPGLLPLLEASTGIPFRAVGRCR